MNLVLPLIGDVTFTSEKSLIVLCGVLAVACIDIVRRISHRTTHLFFATVLGTSLSLGLIRTADMLLHPAAQDNPYAIAFAIILIIIGWKALFGPWETQTKATMLGTFLFWIVIRMFWDDPARQQYVRLIAAGAALIPAVIWCKLFLKYHAERLSSVVLLFLAGALSTVPILFYDALVRSGAEMQFFLFVIKPVSFHQAASQFVNDHMLVSGVQATVLATLLSFMFVGLVEEVSKFWVFAKSGTKLFTSIDDALQLSIIVAIGFAFAENVINPVYFTAFVRDYLFNSDAADFSGFLGNMLGRSVLTSMVHIVSTGVAGYFLGLAIFAGPYLRERHAQGKAYRMLAVFHRILRLPEIAIFRTQMIVTGLTSAVLLHGFFNFLVTLPDILPNNPQTVLDVFHGNAPAFLAYIPLLLIPALFYVVGGFWLLTSLFLRKESMEERGHVVTQETFVKIVAE